MYQLKSRQSELERDNNNLSFEIAGGIKYETEKLQALE
jgi:hypothetical protein